MDTEIAEVAVLKKDLSNDEKMQFDTQYATQRKNPTTALLFSLFLGGVGADRFYTGDTGLGFAKLFTLGGIGVWAIIDLFLIMKATRRKNADMARRIHDALTQTRERTD